MFPSRPGSFLTWLGNKKSKLQQSMAKHGLATQQGIMLIWMRARTHTHARAHTHTHIYIYIQFIHIIIYTIPIYIYIDILRSMHTWMYVQDACMWVCMSACVHVCVYQILFKSNHFCANHSPNCWPNWNLFLPVQFHDGSCNYLLVCQKNNMFSGWIT